MKNQKIRKMTTLSLLIAITVVLQLLGYVLPKIGPFGLSFVLIPIVIGGAVYGPGAGALLGGAFGIIVCFCSYNGIDPGGFMVWQASPLLCIFVVMTKGILAGVSAAFVYRIFKNKNAYFAMVLASAICPIVNTGIFLSGMSLFFMDVLMIWSNGGNVAGYLLSGIILINFVPELLINLILTPASHRIVHAVNR